MASCVRNISAKNYQNLITGFQVTVENAGDTFLRHSVDASWGEADFITSFCPQKNNSGTLFVTGWF